MCNLYSMTRAPEAVLRLFRVAHNRAAKFEPQDAIFPAHIAPIVRRTEDGERELVTMSWGFVLPQSGRAPRRVTNFRDDRTLQSAFWRESFKSRRCLVPASAFAEPRDVKPATWHWFALNAKAQPPEHRPLFAFAGIWRHWQGPVRKAGPDVSIDVFSFMTTTPNALVATINHERMPVLLRTEEEHEIWLTGSCEQAFTLARETPPDAMRIVQEGPDKRDTLGTRPSDDPQRQQRLL
ncbi:MAG: SOS response-associated peptidase [Hyphomicrobiaceae bacterium]